MTGALASSSSPSKPPGRTLHVFSPKHAAPALSFKDSGYHGSQDVYGDSILADDDIAESQRTIFDQSRHNTTNTMLTIMHQSPQHTLSATSPEKIMQVSKQDETMDIAEDEPAEDVPAHSSDSPMKHHDTSEANAPTSPIQDDEDDALKSVQATSPSPATNIYSDEAMQSPAGEEHDSSTHSPSDTSSPIRPMVRKSSLNFASLPAREPLGGAKSAGGRVSRTSHLENHRTSYYSRPTGGKSLGNLTKRDEDEESQDEMDIDNETTQVPDDKGKSNLNHNRAYTQRLQDQISMLGKSQPNATRPSKSIHGTGAGQQTAPAAQPVQEPKSPAATRTEQSKATPGAFPDDDDDWIDPPAPVEEPTQTQSSRPPLAKSFSTDVMEGIHKDDTVSGAGFGEGSTSPEQPVESPTQQRSRFWHAKSTSVSALPTASRQQNDTEALTRTMTVSTEGAAESPESVRPQTPKSPSRFGRESPLKQVKNKFSSILKSSRGFLASSAAISAEGKTFSSPSTATLAVHTAQSTESIIPQDKTENQKSMTLANPLGKDASPTKPVAKRTRASTEREKEEKRREREAKLQEEQMDKLEKAREKEREKARVFSKEQEKMASLEKQVAEQKPEKPAVKETPRPTRSSPRHKNTQGDDAAASEAIDENQEMADAPPMSIPPPSIPRATGPGQAPRAKELRRPVKPTKDVQTKAKQAPTVIRVNTGSQHSQYHAPAGSFPAAASESVGSSTSQPAVQPSVPKASKASLQNKSSGSNLKSSGGRPKALDLAAKKREQDEKEAQRRREAKAEMERKRAAAQEEQRRQEQQKRQEAERQRQKERDEAAQTEARKTAQRQAMIDKAKQTRAPPPAPRSKPNGPPDFVASASQSSSTRPPSRLESNLQRSHDEGSRPVNAVLSTASKAGVKRTLGPDTNNDAPARPPSRIGQPYQAKDAKRRRTSETRPDELDATSPPNIKGPPVRPSAGFKKVCQPSAMPDHYSMELTACQEIPKKSIFSNGYGQAPPSATRDLFKAAVTAQHGGHPKGGNVPDMAQFSKGAIPFAPNPNPAGPAHKTPGRPGGLPYPQKSAAKPAARSSPRFQNGESIELPEIQTDDESDEEDDGPGMVAAWADSPEIKRALMRQETMDPSQIFGPPAPLNMEEVFNKSKDKWHKFRKRTSSANWSGVDRLTEDDIRKDMAARDKLRRDGAWSYDMSKEMM